MDSSLRGDAGGLAVPTPSYRQGWPPEARSAPSLSAPEIFQDLSPQVAAGVMDRLPVREAESGTVFFGGEEAPEVLYMLKSGRVELYRESSDGKRLSLDTLEEGTFFGEMSLVGQSLQGTFAVAVEDSAVCALNSGDVRALMLEHPTVAVRIVEVMASRLQESAEALQEMAYNDLTERIAALLLRLADADTGVLEGYSHRQLASMVGCLRESMTVVLDRFKRNGAVDIGRKRLVITDRGQLERVVRQRSGGSSSHRQD